MGVRLIKKSCVRDAEGLALPLTERKRIAERIANPKHPDPSVAKGYAQIISS